MANKKNKKKVNIKGFPDHDLHITVFIAIGLVSLLILKTCE